MMPAVVVTGISGNLGRTLAKLLHTKHRIIGIDRRPFLGRPKDVQMYELDLRKRKAEDVFRTNEVSSVIHMGIMHDPRMNEEEHHSFNVVGTTRLLEYCVKHNLKKVVILSSANVYGPSPDNSNFLTEDAPLMAASRFSGVRDLIEVDMMTHSFFWRHPQIETVILRPVHIVGPMIQLIQVEDVCRAMEAALTPNLRGVYNVVGPGQVPLSAILRELGRKDVAIPEPLARASLTLLFRYRLASFPPPELDHIQFLCAVDGSAWEKATGWKPRYSMRETIRSVLPG